MFKGQRAPPRARPRSLKCARQGGSALSSNTVHMKSLGWLVGILVVCALVAWRREVKPAPALFRGETVLGVYEQSWKTPKNGCTSRIDPTEWVSQSYAGRFGDSRDVWRSEQAYFDEFVRGLSRFEELFVVKAPGETPATLAHPLHQIDVHCSRHDYVWVLTRRPPLRKLEKSLVRHMAESLDEICED